MACGCVRVDSVTLSIYCTASKRWRRNRRERKRESSFHFSVFFDLPDHQLHASSRVLAGVVSFHWGQKDKEGGDPPAWAAPHKARKFPNKLLPGTAGPAARHPLPQQPQEHP